MDKSIVSGYLHPLTPISTNIKPKGRLQIPVRCILCDIYGTLFISGSGDIGMASEQGQLPALINILIARYGQEIKAPALLEQMQHIIKDEHARLRAHGIDYPEVLIERIWEKLLPGLEAKRRLRFAIEFEMINNPVWPMPGARQLINVCREKGIRLGIISNAQFYTPYLFSWLLGSDAEALGFDVDLTLYSYQYRRAKPSLTLFEAARSRLNEAGIDPGSVAYIGNDMRNDIMPAHKIGFQTILFAGDRRSLRLREEDPISCSFAPDKVVTQLAQLTACLQ